MMGIPKQEFNGIFIAENAHQPSSPELHLQGKCSSRLIQSVAVAQIQRHPGKIWAAHLARPMLFPSVKT
jgi:hypothetical protein